VLSNQKDNELNYPHARTAFFAQAGNKGVQWTEKNGELPPERVSILEPVIGKSQTTFYTQKENSLLQQEDKKGDNKFNANIEPEKVHDLIPEAYRHASNSADNYPGIRTAFYAQTGDLNLPSQAGGPEKVHVLQTKHATSHTTFFDKKNGLWRQDISLVQDGPIDRKDITAVAGPRETD